MCVRQGSVLILTIILKRGHVSVGVYECTEAGGIRNELRPSADLSFGPDGRATGKFQPNFKVSNPV